MNNHPFPILMAEDSEDDIIATKRAWKKNNINNPLYIVKDGEECLDYLFRKNQYSDPEKSPRPGILLLDINMPKLDGHGVLKAVRENESTKNLPVIMLTTSKGEEDKIKGYNKNVNAYIIKPVGFDNFSEAIKRIELFWQLVELPPK